MDFQHVQNIFDDGKAEILIYDKIGQEFDPQLQKIVGVSGVEIANEIALLNQLPDVKEIHVRINSSGGSVLEGYSIFSAILNSGKKVKTCNDGVAASIAGIIFLAGDEREMVDFGRLMIHDPSNGKVQALLNDKQKRMLESFKSSLITILTNNSKLEEGVLANMMSAETWFTPQQAEAVGLVDSIKSTERVYNSEDTVEQIMAISNNLYFQKSKSEKMKDLKNHLGIDENATEETVLDSVKTIQNDLEAAKNDVDSKSKEIETLTNDIESKDKEIETLKNEASEATKKVATMHVKNAIAKGLFDESKEADLIEKCVNDMDGFLSIVEAMKQTPTKIVNEIDNDGGKPKKTLRELEKENPSEVERLRNEEPTVYNQLYKEQYGVEPSN